MGILTGLVGKKSKDDNAAVMPKRVAKATDGEGTARPGFVPEITRNGRPFEAGEQDIENSIRAMFDAGGSTATAEPQTNIWDAETPDMQDAAPAAEAPVQPAPVAAAAPAAQPEAKKESVAEIRNRRNRTRIIGFNGAQPEVVDLFEDKDASTPKNEVVFPVGWLLVVNGPGTGHCFSLFTGMAQIGRGDDQSVQLDFGDEAISRSNHAAIVYDPEDQKFVLGHGGKANIVRLNGRAVVSSTDMEDGDFIKIGETMLMLKVLCGPDFQWKVDGDEDAADNDEGDDDVAIA